MQKLFTKQDLAAHLKVSTRYIELLLVKKMFPPPAYIGDRPIWRENDIVALIENRLGPGQVISAKTKA